MKVIYFHFLLIFLPPLYNQKYYLWVFLVFMFLALNLSSLLSLALLVCNNVFDIVCKGYQCIFTALHLLSFFSECYLYSFVGGFCLFFFQGCTCGIQKSQARGGIRAAAVGLHHCHSNSRFKLHCDLGHSLWQRQILNPLSEAWD